MFVFVPASQALELKPYAGVGLGGFIIKVAGVCNKTTFGGFGQIGVDVSEYFGGELRLGTTNKISYVTSGVNAETKSDYAFSYLAKMQFPVSKEFRLYALAGGTSSRSSSKITTPGSTYVFAASGTKSLTTNTTKFSAGGGIDFRIQDHISIGAEYMRYSSDTSSITTNLKYLF